MSDQRPDVLSFLGKVQEDQTIPAGLRDKAAELTTSIRQQSVLQSDVWIYRSVVAILGITVLATIAGGLGLAFHGDAQNYKLPSEIVAIGSAAVGALAGLLAPSPG